MTKNGNEDGFRQAYNPARLRLGILHILQCLTLLKPTHSPCNPDVPTLQATSTHAPARDTYTWDHLDLHHHVGDSELNALL